MGVVGRLKMKGLVGSELDTTDKRRSVISLTTGGNSLITTLKTAGARIPKQRFRRSIYKNKRP